MGERERYRVYVDETGDPGWGGRSSPVFVVTAVIVREADSDGLRSMLDGITRTLDKPSGAVLHWAQNVQAHSSRKYVARTLAEAPITVVNAVTIKPPMMGSPTRLSDPIWQYNYAVRRIFERISW